jgi:hypothetical protein
MIVARMPCGTGGGDNYTMPIGVVASTHSDELWEPRDRDLKRYIHFDRHIPVRELRKIANDPERVAKHSFFPLLRFFEQWTKFRKNKDRKKKTRPLRFAARIDAAIYARYRAKLSKCYEAELTRRGIEEIPVAYRRIPKAGGGNKSNIEIARDVFSFIRSNDNCFVTVVDIKSYFESLDHERIRKVWTSLLGGDFPPDHAAVYRSVTNYSIVDLNELFSRLNLNELSTVGNNRQRRMRKIDNLRENGYKQICSPRDFREVVAGCNPAFPSLIQKNGFDFGIPQGTPISDLIANIYLMDFDQLIHAWAIEKGGFYRRYSDDIVVVIPRSDSGDPNEAKNFLQSEIKKHGRQLRIQDRKVCVVEFLKSGDEQQFRHIYGSASRNGLEYLGFEYNGVNVKIKNSTLSNAWRKIKRRAHGHAWRFVKRYKAKGRVWLEENYPKKRLETEILRDVTYNQDVGFDTWTFVKYIRRSSRAFLGFKPIFSNQTKRYRRYTKLIIADAFNKALDAHC